MKTNYLKGSMLLITLMAVTIGVTAQSNDSIKRAFNAGRYNNDDQTTRTKDGKLKEHIRTNRNGTFYEMTLVNNQMTELYVEGEKVPQAKWGDYSKVIAQIREQIRKDKIQAKKDQAQARRDQIQAGKDQEQARRDQLQAKKDQEQARKDQLQAEKDEQQARADAKQAQEEAARDQEEARKDQEQARKDQEQAKLDQEQARKDQEQARLDQIQARKDQEEARKDQVLMKELIADLISDKIVPNGKSLHEMSLNSDEMTVNGKKQPDEVFKKYKEKYKRFSAGEFSYENSENVRGIHMSRHNIK